MGTVVLFLLGAAVGVLLAFGAFVAGRKRTHSYRRDPIYAAARYAASRHLRAHGTLTVATLRDSLQAPNMTTQRYLDQMEREGLLKRHGHGESSFYTRGQ
jgi:hypothetical protein